MLVESGAVLFVPWLGGLIIGGLFTQDDVSIGLLAGGLIGLLFLQSSLQILQRRVLQRTVERLTAGLRIGIYDHLQRLPLPWLEDQRRGELLSLMTREVDVLSEFVTGSLLGIVPQLIVLTGSLALMLTIDPILTIPIVLGVPAFYIFMKIFGRNIRPLAGQIRDAYATWVSLADENLSILPVIKAYTRETIEAQRIKTSVLRHRDLQERMIAYQSLLGPIVNFIAAASVVLILWLAGGKVAEGEMGAGELVSFLLYAGLLTRPVARFADLWGQFQHARGALRHMTIVLAMSPEARQGDPLPKEVKGNLCFESIRFRYAGRPELLRDVSFEITAGQTVAILGRNGAGKSTLVDLLLRFRTPDEGTIRLDGRDISTVELSAYRQTIALVPQRVALIDGTISDNIRLGLPDATRDQVEHAAREAEAWAFISELREGLDTKIGEAGIRLSGGQRQRVALARALLKKPAILVLDEPTAMFDPESEARFVETARKALAGSTVILITHRPASLALADRVLNLRGGKIDEDRMAPRIGTARASLEEQ
ncbi:ABC transporter ATP-binding protein [Aliiruegeria lutimaris]|uniref:ATP-binding cassette, subfamily B, MsbA n=1 Tax=Aliiruegeria lutimaris TaxID=571298 RepID=A0A1G9DUD4_9RHOB|nr:ABC transporter ATP-binding protein [Aliiruegeria lutimaris]SDK67481.1 ATP-binding cassette, subfamily B, MsbA [Aliiruegeria lutimaris]